jgi:hypothetical protein
MHMHGLMTGIVHRKKQLCVQVKLVSSLKHMATALEVHAGGTTPSGQPRPPWPCATAHSITMEQLPHAGLVSFGSTAPTLDATAAKRAFIIRCGDADWAVLTGVRLLPLTACPCGKGVLCMRIFPCLVCRPLAMRGSGITEITVLNSWASRQPWGLGADTALADRG